MTHGMTNLRSIEKKEKIIDKILSNSTYLPQSGLILNLRNDLRKLSSVALANLELIVSLKVQDAEEEGFGRGVKH